MALHPHKREAIEQRIIQAAEAALARRQYVSAIDVLSGAGMLTTTHLDAWRKGRVDFLERVIQGNLKKISLSMKAFRKWAADRGLKPSETRYVRRTRGGTLDLRFSKSGDPGIERSYRTHYVSPVLSERKKQQLEEKLSRSPQPVVFEILRDSACSECGAAIHQGGFLYMEAEQPFCLACARFDDLEYLPSGDAALTRRSAKYSARTAVVVRFSRTRGRYERQGILVETTALEKAEQECYEDADARASARAASALRRKQDDRAFVAQVTARLRVLFPRCPQDETAAIAEHTAARGSGRVGRTAAGRRLEEQALTAAVTAAVRHRHTGYDSLLASGLDRNAAREEVFDRVQEVLASWRG